MADGHGAVADERASLDALGDLARDPGVGYFARRRSASAVIRMAESHDDRRWSAVRALVTAGVLMVVVLASVVLLLNWLAGKDTTAALSLVLVAAAVVLILVMATLTIVFRRLRIHDRHEAMGLPPGSMRAVIALLLIMLFFIVAIYLYGSTRAGVASDEDRTLTGVSGERVATIPTDQIKQMTPVTGDSGVSFDLVLYPPSGSTTTSDDIAKQLVTTVGTLVTAVAAFYFGANVVSNARRAVVADATAGGAPGEGQVRGDGPTPLDDGDPASGPSGAATQDAPDATTADAGGEDEAADQSEPVQPAEQSEPLQPADQSEPLQPADQSEPLTPAEPPGRTTTAGGVRRSRSGGGSPGHSGS